MAAATVYERALLIVLLSLFGARLARARENAEVDRKRKADLPAIADEPKTVDPATLMPESLTKLATCDLSDSSLIELIDWLREKQGIVVLLNKQALSDIGMLPSEPVSDHLDSEPVYFLLNRLRALNLKWYLEDGIVHIGPAAEVESRLTTTPHNIGDLLDAGYERDTLMELIEEVVAPASWGTVGGLGALSALGDVLFVRQTDGAEREVLGLLAALREHGRMTFSLDPPQHAVFRQKLSHPVSVDFRDTPLETAVEELAEKSNADIRLDRPALREIRIRQREPVTLALDECKLETVLAAMLMDLELTWLLRDGVLWITSRQEAETFLKAAVYDVRDLCRDSDESDALRDAIRSQAAPDSWGQVGGPGSIQFAKPGTMVVLNEECILLQVLDLLQTYRTALRSSKPRDRDAAHEQEVITVYYRMHAAVADDLAVKVPELVSPDSWQDQAHPEAPGNIVRVASPPELLALEVARDNGAKHPAGTVRGPLTEQAVLIITQRRAAHREIESVIRRVEQGDGSTGAGPETGGMGGFGGGFFALPPNSPDKK